MIQIDFDYTGKVPSALFALMEEYVSHYGMFGGGTYSDHDKHFTFYIEAHDCSCGTVPRKTRISPKMREGMLEILRQKTTVKNLTWKRIRL